MMIFLFVFVIFLNSFWPVHASIKNEEKKNTTFVLSDFNKKIMLGGSIGLFSLLFYYLCIRKNGDSGNARAPRSSDKKIIPMNKILGGPTEQENNTNLNKTRQKNKKDNSNTTKEKHKKSGNFGSTHKQMGKNTTHKYYQTLLFNFDNYDSQVVYDIFSDPNYKVIFTQGKETVSSKGSELLNLASKHVEKTFFIPYCISFKKNNETEAEFHCAFKTQENVLYICQRSYDWSAGWLKEQLLLEILEYHLRQLYKDIKIINKIGTYESKEWWEKNGYINNEKNLNSNEVYSYEFSIKNLLGIKKFPEWYIIKNVNLANKNDHFLFLPDVNGDSLENDKITCLTKEELDYFAVLKKCGITEKTRLTPFLIKDPESNSIYTGVIDEQKYVAIITAGDPLKTEQFIPKIEQYLNEHYPNIIAIVAENTNLLYTNLKFDPQSYIDYKNLPTKYIRYMREIEEQELKAKNKNNFGDLTLEERQGLIKKYINFADVVSYVFDSTQATHPEWVPYLLETKIKGKSLKRYVKKGNNNKLKDFVLERYEAIILSVKNLREVLNENNESLEQELFNVSKALSQSYALSIWSLLSAKEFSALLKYQATEEFYQKTQNDKNLKYIFFGLAHAGEFNLLICNSNLSSHTKAEFKKILFRIASDNPVDFHKIMNETTNYFDARMYFRCLLTAEEEKQLKENIKEGQTVVKNLHPTLPVFGGYTSNHESFNLSDEYKVDIVISKEEREVDQENEYLELKKDNLKTARFIPGYIALCKKKIAIVKMFFAIRTDNNIAYIYKIYDDQGNKENESRKKFLYGILGEYIKTDYSDICFIKKYNPELNIFNIIALSSKVIPYSLYKFLLKNSLKINILPDFINLETIFYDESDKEDGIFLLRHHENVKGGLICFGESKLDSLPVLKTCGITENTKIKPFLIKDPESNSICTGVIDKENYVVIITACDPGKSEYFMQIIKNYVLKNYPDIVAIAAEDKELLGYPSHKNDCVDYKNLPITYVQSIVDLVKKNGKRFGFYSTAESNLKILTLEERKELIKKYINFAEFIKWIFIYTTKPYPDMLPELLKTRIQGKNLIRYVEFCGNNQLEECIRKEYANIILPVKMFRKDCRKLKVAEEALKNKNIYYEYAYYNISLALSKYNNSPLWFQLTEKELSEICIYQATNKEFNKYYDSRQYNDPLILLPSSIVYYYPSLSQGSTKKLKNILFQLAKQRNSFEFYKLMKKTRKDKLKKRNFTYLLTEDEEKDLKNYLIEFNQQQDCTDTEKQRTFAQYGLDIAKTKFLMN